MLDLFDSLKYCFYFNLKILTDKHLCCNVLFFMSWNFELCIKEHVLDLELLCQIIGLFLDLIHIFSFNSPCFQG